MKRQPAESKNQHQAEDRLGYFPPLDRHRNMQMLKSDRRASTGLLGAVRTVRSYLFHVVVERDPHAFFAAEHLAGHECVEECSARQG